MWCRQHSISESTQKARRGRIEVISYMVKIFPVMLHQHMMVAFNDAIQVPIVVIKKD